MTDPRHVPKPLINPFADFEGVIRVLVSVPGEEQAFFCAVIEGHENLAICTTIDRARGIVQVTCSPEQEATVRDLLVSLRSEVPFEVL